MMKVGTDDLPTSVTECKSARTQGMCMEISGIVQANMSPLTREEAHEQTGTSSHGCLGDTVAGSHFLVFDAPLLTLTCIVGHSLSTQTHRNFRAYSYCIIVVWTTTRSQPFVLSKHASFFASFSHASRHPDRAHERTGTLELRTYVLHHHCLDEDTQPAFPAPFRNTPVLHRALSIPGH